MLTRHVPALALALAALLAVCLLSISVGARPIALDRVWSLVFHPDGSDDAIIVQDLRIPRTILGLIVGAALGVGGALMQALTRNPIADPGLLGVNAGAAAAVVTATRLLGTTSTMTHIWFAFAGAALASVVVYGIGATGRSGATPVRLALAGTAVTLRADRLRAGRHADRPRGARRVPLLAGRRARRPPGVAERRRSRRSSRPVCCWRSRSGAR